MTQDTKQLERRIEELEKRINELETKISGPEIQSSGRSKSLNEFKMEHDVSAHTEKAVLIGYFIEAYESIDEWSLHEIEEGYKRCKWPLPSNLSDVLRRTEGKGHIMQVGSRDRAKIWQLTQTGIDFVEDDLRKGEE